MKKLISLLVVVAFALTLVPVAKADTVADLTANIAQLQAQISAIQGDTSVVHFCFYTNLKYGMKNNDIKLMQEKLGVINTGYFGPLTLAAVNSFQIKYRSEILDPLGLTSATGFVGAATRAKLNTLYCGGAATGGVTIYPAGCTSAAGFSITTGYPCSTAITYPAGCTSAVGFSPTTGVKCDNTTVITVPVTTATEGSLTLVSAPVATIASVGPSEIGDAIMAFGVKAKDSAMSIKRVDVRLQSSASALPWKYFTNLYLYQDSTLVATLPVTSTSLIETNFGTDYTARFDGLNVAIAKDATANFTVKADIVATIPATPVTYTVGITSMDAIRGIDGIGLNQYVYDTGTAYNKSITFTATNQGKLNVISDAANPVISNIATSTTSSTTGIIATVFDLQNTSKYDVTVKQITATIDNNAGVSGYYLYDGSTLISAVGNPGTTALSFSNLNYVVAAGTTKVLTIKLDAAQSASGPVKADVVTVSSAVDTMYNIIAPVSTATGNVLTLQSSGAVLTFVSGIADKVTSTASVTGLATGTIVFTVKANGVNLAKLSQTSTTAITMINAQDGAAAQNVTWTVSPDSTLSDGATATITATGTISAVAGCATVTPVKFQITDVKFSTLGTTSKLVDVSTGFDSFVTNLVYLQ